MDSKVLDNIFKTKNYLDNYRSKKYISQTNSNFYLASYANSIGYYVLKKIFNSKNNFFANIYIIISDILFGINISGKIIKNKVNIKKFSKIIFSWGIKDNFNEDGSFNDKYFNINSTLKKDFLWIIIYLDHEKPKNLSNNIILFNVYGNKISNIYSWLKFIISNTKNLLKGFDYFLFNISSYSFLSKKLVSSSKFFFLDNCEKIIFPYEGQPFQNEIIKFFKNKDNKTKIIGYVHGPPMAVPTNFIFKDNCPDKIFLSGDDQKYCFEKILGWPSERIAIVPSLRFREEIKKKENTIFLPYVIKNSKEILNNLDFINKRIINLNNFKIKNHPGSSKKNANLKLVKEIEKILITENNVKNDRYELIFIGNSGAIIECLERGYKVLQVCEDPNFDYFSSDVWKSIISEKISENIYSYKLREKGNLINFGKINTNLDTILNY